jgi:hypothetical protein
MAMRFFDLENRLRTDPAFAGKAQQGLEAIKTAMLSAVKDPSRRGDVQKHTIATLKLCGYNPILFSKYLVPMMFGGKPLTFTDYPLAYYMTTLIPELDLTVMGSRQISKSTAIAYRYIALGHILRGYSGYYIVPHPEHLKTFARRFDDMYTAFRFRSRGSKLGEVNNMYLKKFRKGSFFALFHVLEDDTKARGKTGDEICIDEYQNFDIDFHAVIDEILSASEWRIMIKAGTSLHTDTALNYSFERSSMGYWHIFCEHCGHENIPLMEEGVLDMIQPTGPCCIKCGKPLRPETGHFVHRYPERIDREDPKIGIHVPQIFTPAVLKNKARWRALYNKKVHGGSIEKFLQENIGLPTEQGLREITEHTLRSMCKEDNGDDRKKAAYYQELAKNKRNYRFVLSGCDWGGSDHNRSSRRKVSTTVHAMAGMKPDGRIELIHFRRYEAMNYAEIIDDIVQNHKRMNGYAMASDFGVGYYYNSKLRDYLPASRHLVFQYTGPRSRVISRPLQSEMINHYVINKTETISMLYEAIKNRRILCFNWEESNAFLNDYLQVYRNVHESDTGVSTFTWASNPSKPNDSLQATNYIFILAKILKGEPIFEDSTLEYEVNALITGSAAQPTNLAAGAYSG